MAKLGMSPGEINDTQKWLTSGDDETIYAHTALFEDVGS